MHPHAVAQRTPNQLRTGGGARAADTVIDSGFQRRGIPFSAPFLKYGGYDVDADVLAEATAVAQSIYFWNLVVMQWFSLLAVRARRRSIVQQDPIFDPRTRNLRLFGAMAFALGFGIFFHYLPFFQRVFLTRGIAAELFFVPLGYGAGILALDEARKAANRRWPGSWLARVAWSSGVHEEKIVSPAAFQKRGREEFEQGPSPGKRAKTFALAEAQREPPVSLPTPVPTPNFSSALAQQQQRALEAMMSGALEREDIEMDMDGGVAMDPNIVSNPMHPWNAAGISAPSMSHQLSNSASSSSNGSSMPGTPLDMPFNEQWMPNATAQAVPPYKYPSPSNPTSFTDLNGCTHVFSSSPPLSVYPPPPPTPTSGTFERANPMDTLGFPAHAWGAAVHHQSPSKSAGVLRMEPSMGAGAGIPRDDTVRELQMPTYGWDVPRQANTLNMGAHLI
ncbi:hypothetical protein JCM3770_000813 [Rhodotorula araucariae]